MLPVEPGPEPIPRVLYILGSGHCGSTLLDMLLNGHPRILGLGEISAVRRYNAIAAGRRFAAPHPAGGPDWVEVWSHPFDAPEWRAVMAGYEAATGRPFAVLDLRSPSWRTAWRWNQSQVRRWAEPNAALFAAARVTGAEVLVDASKSPQRLYLLQRSGRVALKVVHLVRDGRAVVNSYLRKYGRPGLAFRRWAAPTAMALYLRRRFPSQDWLQVRYEELATHPEAVLKGICVFLALPYDRAMLEYRARPYLGIGGNAARQQEDAAIILDERWKSELGGARRLVFAILGGWLNRLYGY